VSWRILLDDLEVACGQLAAGQEVSLGAPTTSFRDWAGQLAGLARSGGLDGELDHWAAAVAAAQPLPAGREPGPETGTGQVSVLLDAADTEALLRAAPAAYRTRINDVLLAALARALGRWTGSGQACVDLEGHGREDILDGVDLSRTVGWFTTVYPVLLTADTGDQPDWRALVKSVRRQLRAIPGNGIGYGALRWLGTPQARERLGTGPGPQIAFNYLGQWDARSSASGDGLVADVHGAFGQDHDPADPGQHLLEVVGAVTGGQLGFTWLYRPGVHDRSAIEAVAGDFAAALRDIAADCRRD
jgi:non-ribosomal peptide synthase protein (TIGR01720 family)